MTGRGDGTPQPADTSAAAGPADTAAPRRRGRPRSGAADGPGARARILASAGAQFAARGYDRVSIRGIAREAGVDPALVHHYFGSKEQVFTAALETAFAPVRSGLQSLPDVGPEALGEQLVRFLFGVWEDPGAREPVLALVRSAVSNDTAAGLFRGMVAGAALPLLTARLDGPDRELRAELALAQLVGVMMMRYIVRVEPIASQDVEQLAARLIPVVQHHLTGP